MRSKSTLEVLIRYVLSIGILGALFTLALDQLLPQPRELPQGCTHW